MCETCARRGRNVLASAVDHVLPINAGGEAFPSLDGLRSLCASCHNLKTREEQLGRRPMIKGCDCNGLPLDDAHEFYGITPSKDQQLGRSDRIGARKLTYSRTRRP
jgi:hypothetical protein